MVKGRIPLVAKLKNQTCNMFRISTFQQLMKGLPRGSFDTLVSRHNADKYCKRFGHWQHLIAMLYAQFSGVSGLRPLEAGFNSHAAHHYHLGSGPIRRTTLADANERRPDTVFTDTATWLMGQVGRQLKKECKELLYLLDSTSITLKGREYDRWTLDNRTRNTQGIKLHLMFDWHEQVPRWHSFSAANVNDVDLTGQVPLKSGARYVFDKGYCDYNWWHRIDAAQAWFYTRFKSNAAVLVQQECPIPSEAAGIILSDEIVCFKHKKQRRKHNHYHGKALRRVTIARPDKSTPLVLATNDLDSSALEIAQRYKERWAIELFFKWIKQHLKIKQFLGRSENAVRIQLLTALISYLLVAIYKHSNALTISLWECLTLVRATLFQRPATEETYYRRRRQERELQAQTQGCLF